MATSRVLSPTQQSAWKDPALGGASLALKIAKEATMGVPLLGQIFGVAHTIAELAEKTERNKDALRMLAKKAATLSKLVEKLLADRTVDDQLAEVLERLVLVFGKVEDFLSKETAKSNVIKKTYRTLLVTKKKTEELANELDNESHGFMIATLLDTRLYLSKIFQHNGTGQFRRLRDYEVGKLGIISEYRSEHGAVTLAQARVEGVAELMVVKYIEGTVYCAHLSGGKSAKIPPLSGGKHTAEQRLFLPNEGKSASRRRISAAEYQLEISQIPLLGQARLMEIPPPNGVFFDSCCS